MNSETTSTNEGENVVRTRSRSIGTATPAQQQSVPSTPQRITNPLTSPGFQPQDLKNDAAGSPVQTGTFPITTTPITSPALKESSGGLATPKKKAEAAFDDIVATIFSCSKKAGQVVNKTHPLTTLSEGIHFFLFWYSISISKSAREQNKAFWKSEFYHTHSRHSPRFINR